MKVNIDLHTAAPRTVLMGRYKLKDPHEFSPIGMGFVNPRSCLWWDSEWLSAGHSDTPEETGKIDTVSPGSCISAEMVCHCTFDESKCGKL